MFPSSPSWRACLPSSSGLERNSETDFLRKGEFVTSTFELVIRPRKGWQPVDLKEIWLYRELLGFLVWRDIKIRYKQTALGGLWAILQPLVAMLIFGALFGRVTGMKGDGSPYPLFVFSGLVPWTFFSNAVGLSSNSLIGSEQMIRKIYFPRILVPLGAIFALGLDLVISLGFMAVMMLFYHWHLTWALLWIPFLLLGTLLATSGIGLFLSALNVQYRDVKYVVPFVTQMVFFLTPVLYPMSNAPTRLKPVLILNPMAGMVEGFRHALLGSAVSWNLVLVSFGICIFAFVSGMYFFRSRERFFADLI
jgi:lipopolysaccharide transport system permease protein